MRQSRKTKTKCLDVAQQSRVKEIGEKIADAIGDKNIDVLRVLGCKNKFGVPSTSIPNHHYIVHITTKGSSCDCPQKRKCIGLSESTFWR